MHRLTSETQHDSCHVRRLKLCNRYAAFTFSFSFFFIFPMVSRESDLWKEIFFPSVFFYLSLYIFFFFFSLSLTFSSSLFSRTFLSIPFSPTFHSFFPSFSAFLFHFFPLSPSLLKTVTVKVSCYPCGSSP